MKHLSKNQAEKITEITSSIYPQGASWVLKEWDLDSGTTKLTRGLSQSGAKRRLKNWRKEKIEELLRGDGSAKAYAIKTLHKNHSWKGAGVWQWALKRWYTTKLDAETALRKTKTKTKTKFEQEELAIHELTTAEIPGHIMIA